MKLLKLAMLNIITDIHEKTMMLTGFLKFAM